MGTADDPGTAGNSRAATGTDPAGDPGNADRRASAVDPGNAERGGTADRGASAGDPGGAGVSRRSFLSAVGVAGAGPLAGCVVGGRSGESTTVAILAAGSLQHALENGLKPAVDVPVRIEAHGSATVARMVAEGQRDPDVLTVADRALFEAPLSPPWYSVFASNAVVLAYNPDTEGGRRVASAGPDRWYEPLLSGEVSLGRTDPDQDPLGYRALFALELASRYYDDAPALHERIPSRDQVYPETGLVSRFETGSIDAALAYRNMAVERGYEYVAFPDEIDLSHPGYVEDWYSTVSYELPTGRTIRGDLIGYASTIRRSSEAARSVFAAHTTGEYMAEAGFLVDDRFPYYEGDPPDAVRAATGGSTDDRPGATGGSTGSETDATDGSTGSETDATGGSTAGRATDPDGPALPDVVSELTVLI